MGVVAVDHTSPISSGAILGDRVRMIEHSRDNKVFIKSLATRGWYGGLSKSAARIINILDAMSKEVIMLETVGVGQTEGSIMDFAHTTVLVLVPEMGDYIQTIKAGVLEIGDIFVINKTDNKDPNELLVNMHSLLEHQEKNSFDKMWKKQIFLTSAKELTGFDKLLNAINAHREFFLKFKEDIYLKNRAIRELSDEIYSNLIDLYNKKITKKEDFEKFVEKIKNKEKDPYSIAKDFIKRLKINAQVD